MLIEANPDPGPMNPPKVDDLDYIHFLVAAQKVFTCTEAARSQPAAAQPASEDVPAHDAFTRLLQRRPPDTEALWQEAEPFVDRSDGLLILDDTTLDKPYANKIEHVTWHWSGKHGRAVKGINLLTLLWGGQSEKEKEDAASDAEEERKEAHLPCDFRLYNKDEDGLSKNDHFRQMLERASKRGFEPEYVVFDSWYSGLENLKKVRSLGWHFFTRLKKNRHINPDDTYNRAIEEVEIPEEGRVMHLKGFDFVKVFRTGSKEGREILGHQRPSDGRGRTRRVGASRLGGGDVSSPAQAVLRGRAFPAPERSGTAQPRAHVDPSVSAVGSASARNGGQFL